MPATVVLLNPSSPAIAPRLMDGICARTAHASRSFARAGAHVLVGPRAHLVGADVADDCFLATGATVFNGARLGRGCQVQINGLVHLRTVLPAGTLVPIG